MLALGVTAAAGAATAPPPLSPAQTALFETAQLQNVTRPGTLEYRYVQEGDGGFQDRILLNVEKIHPDGTKYVGFDFLSGERHVNFPAVDDFRGNPLLMLFLEHDVRDMKERVGIPATYLRNRLRKAFFDQATISDTTVAFGGRQVPAQRITVQPFAHDPRFEQLTVFRDKTYTFVLADAVPGMIAELAAETPADPAVKVPALGARITFVGDPQAADQPSGDKP